ncbi:MAG: hypothetical protein DRG66_04685 [Deltaproteobacteria bacterium]|nr:MAG: hypothetical protein DRG66_04685 [Deltaproteobacteria bacterium]
MGVKSLFLTNYLPTKQFRPALQSATPPQRRRRRLTAGQPALASGSASNPQGLQAGEIILLITFSFIQED